MRSILEESWARVIQATYRDPYRTRESEPRRISRTTPLNIAISFLLLALAVAVHFAWWKALDHLEQQAPRTSELASLEIDMGPGLPVTIGRNELAQWRAGDAAEDNHALFRRDRQGRLMLGNAARERRIYMVFSGGRKSFASAWWPMAGDRLMTRDMEINFTSVGARRLEFTVTRNGAPARYVLDTSSYLAARDLLLVDGKPVEACNAPGERDQLSKRIFSGFRLAVERPLERMAQFILPKFNEEKSRTVLRIGGLSNCHMQGSHHLGAPELPWRGIRILHDGKTFHILPGSAGPSDLGNVRFARNGEIISGFRGIEWQIVGGADGSLASLTLGRTSYAVSFDPADGSGSIILKPSGKSHVFRTEETIAPGAPCAADLDGVPSIRDGVSASLKRCLAMPSSILERGSATDLNALADGNVAYLRFGLMAVGGVFWAVSLAVLLVRAVAGARHGQLIDALRRELWPALSVIAFSGIIGLLVFWPELQKLRGGDPVGLVQGLKLSAIAFGLVFGLAALRLAGRFSAGLALLMISALLAYGSVVLLSLALDGSSTHWLSHIAKHKLVFLDALAIMLAFVVAMPAGTIGKFLSWALLDPYRTYLRYFRGKRALALTIATFHWVILLILVLGPVVVSVAGNEEGIAGFQPVELGKIIIVLFFAYMLTGIERAVGMSSGQGIAARASKQDKGLGSWLVSPWLWWFGAIAISVAGWYAMRDLRAEFEIAMLALAIVGFVLLAVKGFKVARAGNAYLRYLLSATAVTFLFLVVLLVVPAANQDFSPILIILFTLFLMLIIFGGRWIYGWLEQATTRAVAYRKMPRMKRVTPTRVWQGRAIAGILFIGCVISVFVGYNSYSLAYRAISGAAAPADDIVKRLKDLEPEPGPFATIAGRFYTQHDLSHDPEDRKPTGETDQNGEELKRFIIYDRDLGLQLFRSKKAIARAPCGLQRFPNDGLGIVSNLDWLAALLMRDSDTGLPLCAADPLEYKPAEEPAAINASAGPGGNVQNAGIGSAGGALSIDDIDAEPEYHVDNLVAIPVIQNDFIGAYVVARFGIAGMLGMVLLQTLSVVMLFILYWSLAPGPLASETEKRDRKFLRMAVFGVATLMGLHWLIAWSNVLGLLPVMGQPMSLTAAATSHHLFTILPALILVILAARHQENTFIRSVRIPPGPGARSGLSGVLASFRGR